jgi:hypothetical protein
LTHHYIALSRPKNGTEAHASVPYNVNALEKGAPAADKDISVHPAKHATGESD